MCNLIDLAILLKFLNFIYYGFIEIILKKSENHGLGIFPNVFCNEGIYFFQPLDRNIPSKINIFQDINYAGKISLPSSSVNGLHVFINFKYMTVLQEHMSDPYILRSFHVPQEHRRSSNQIWPARPRSTIFLLRIEGDESSRSFMVQSDLPQIASLLHRICWWVVTGKCNV